MRGKNAPFKLLFLVFFSIPIAQASSVSNKKPQMPPPELDEHGKPMLADTSEVFQHAMALYHGAYSDKEGLKDFISSQKLVIDQALRDPDPLLANLNHEITPVSTRLENIQFCTGGDYDNTAKFYNSLTSLDEKAPMLAGLAACFSGKESGDHWFDVDALLTPENPNPEIGFFGLDANSKKGSQNMCIRQFAKWGITSQLGMNPGEGNAADTVGPQYASTRDQRYNVGCGTYFLISAWIANQTKSGNSPKCTPIAPNKANGGQYGSLQNHKFKYCIDQMGHQDNYQQVYAGYHNKSAPEYGPFLAAKWDKNH